MRTALLGIALAALVAAPVRADVFAVAPVVAPGHSDIDVGLIDASTGVRLTLPASVNSRPTRTTRASRRTAVAWPSSVGRPRGDGSDHRRADVSTGQTLDLFDAIQAATDHPSSPVISADGTFVTTGSQGHGLFMRSLQDFPVQVSVVASRFVFPGDAVLDPTPSVLLDPGMIAYRRSVPLSGGGTVGQVLVENAPDDFSSNHPLVVRPGAVHVAHPVIRPKEGRSSSTSTPSNAVAAWDGAT